MSPETCTRVDEALAAGNVWGDAALLEHAKGCEVCASELVVLKKRREFRDAFPTLSSIADQGVRAKARGRGKESETALASARRRRVLLMMGALVATVGFVGQRWLSPAQSTPDEAAGPRPPRFRIYNLENALFESKVEGETVRSVISRGVASFQVDPLGPHQRFLVTLPDGDLEVRGTRFVVAIEGGKTSSIDVTDGSVVLRLRGQAEMVLIGGQHWPTERPTLSFMRPPTPRDAGSAPR